MNLLPKSHEEFNKVEYWNTFFRKRGKKSFDWYGEYPELCGYLSKYAKTKDLILVVGCGSSTLSADLYDVGYRNITNIDISEVVIKKMQKINESARPSLRFEHMDATCMTYPNERFSVVLDKGTLDALMPSSNVEATDTVDKFFGFLFRILRCHEAEEKARKEENGSMPVFIVVATKFLNLPKQVLEISLAGTVTERVNTIEDIEAAVATAQMSALVCNSLFKGTTTNLGEIALDLYRPTEKVPRYTLYILDKVRPKGSKTYAAFIVPRGRDPEWLFSTKEGRQQLLDTVQRDRLVIIIQRRECTFEGIDAVKRELEGSVRNFAPAGLGANVQIPYISLGDDTSSQKILYEGKSEISGPVVVEDVDDGKGSVSRRLIFLNNQFVIQSEARLKTTKSRRGKLKTVIDPMFLSCEHHINMSVAASLEIHRSKDCEILIMGLGGGGLCTFLHRCFPHIKLVAVDIDELMLHVATDYFGLVQNEKLRVVISDGIEFLKQAANEDKKFTAILFDVNGKDNSLGMSCPPKEFLEDSTLQLVQECLATNGVFVLNLACRDENLAQNVLEKLRKIFRAVMSWGLQGAFNRVVLCWCNPNGTKDLSKRLQNAVRYLNNKFDSSVDKSTGSKETVVNASSLIDELTIHRNDSNAD
ncbi:methyltransferase-like protein 13 isoform X2 [Orussus abietinus]|uniref:methyltransferase-like protein 13 isoform X2 n=1 Tax=Orussus abietinus TaxID=222816 RepID=UPI000625A0FC|nr:methyltransferase-like protein 13 isoform X2 [Orussus abietinus]